MQQRAATGPRLGDGQHLTDHDGMVAAVVHGGGPALHRRQRAVFSASSVSTDTAQVPVASTASWNRAIFSAQNSTRSGSSDTEAKAVTVIA